MKIFNSPKNNKEFNEFYTTEETAEKVLRPWLSILQNKKICCPCDSISSAIVKWLLLYTNSEIIYFNDKDFNSTEARDIMKACDLIVTNPPFSMKQFKPFTKFLLENNIDFIVFSGMGGIQEFLNDVYVCKYFKPNMLPYNTPSGNIKYAATYILSTIDIPIKRLPCKYTEKDLIPISSVGCFSKDDYYFEEIHVPKTFIRYALRRKEK